MKLADLCILLDLSYSIDELRVYNQNHNNISNSLSTGNFSMIMGIDCYADCFVEHWEIFGDDENNGYTITVTIDDSRKREY